MRSAAAWSPSTACVVAGTREAPAAWWRVARPEPPTPGRRRRSADLVDTVGVERDVILDLRHRFEWGLISPHRIARAIPASRNAVVGSVALVGAIRRVLATRERGHIDIPTGDILNGRIGGLANRQRSAGVGDNLSADRDHDARRVRSDRNGVVGPRNLPRLVSHDLYPSELETVPRIQKPRHVSYEQRGMGICHYGSVAMMAVTAAN